MVPWGMRFSTLAPFSNYGARYPALERLKPKPRKQASQARYRARAD